MSTDSTSSRVDDLLAPLPEACKDLRLNLSSVLRGTSLEKPTTYCAAIAAAYFAGSRPLADALSADAQGTLSAEEIADAQAAAALMGMTTVYYKSRELLGKPAYEQMRPSLRMNRMLSPASKVKYEAAAMACAAIAACPSCLKSHEKQLLEAGLSETNVHDLVRLAAIVQGVVIALGMV